MARQLELSRSLVKLYSARNKEPKRQFVIGVQDCQEQYEVDRQVRGDHKAQRLKLHEHIALDERKWIDQQRCPRRKAEFVQKAREQHGLQAVGNPELKVSSQNGQNRIDKE